MGRPSLRVFALIVIVAANLNGLAASAAAGDLRLQLTPQIAGEVGAARQLGIRAGAADGVDALDRPEPPAAPGDCPLVGMRLPSFAEPPFPLWRHDFRDPATLQDQGRLTWELRLCTGYAPGPVALAFAALDTVAFDYRLELHRDDGPVLEIPVPGTVEVSMDAPERTVHVVMVLEGGSPVRTRSWTIIRNWYR